MYMPASRQGEAYKFSKPFDDPFRIVSLYDNGADLDKSKSKLIRVALNRMRKCPKEICFSEARNSETVESSKEGLEAVEAGECESSPWSGRLRSRCCSKDAEPKEGEM